MNVPDVINDVLNSPGTSDWLRNALRSALEGDEIRVRNDAEFLLVILDARLEQLPQEAPAALPIPTTSPKNCSHPHTAFPSDWLPPMAQVI